MLRSPFTPFDPFDGCCETPFSLGGEATNFGRVLCSFGFAGALAPWQMFLVSPGRCSFFGPRHPFLRICFRIGLSQAVSLLPPSASLLALAGLLGFAIVEVALRLVP